MSPRLTPSSRDWSSTHGDRAAVTHRLAQMPIAKTRPAEPWSHSIAAVLLIAVPISLAVLL